MESIHTNPDIAPENQTLALATLGGGCFWCIEPLFQSLQGVTKVESGYSGGQINNPTYREICSGLTGHAEVIQIQFNPSIVSYREILDVFFEVHDPTTLNRQGNDSGPQYRSVVFYHSDAQRQVAEEARTAAQAHWSNPIVTEISPLINYFPAEAYHQNYYATNPNQPYCAFVIGPKIQKFRKQFGARLKESAG
jgi:peptide-methionine (S)-S-oxide reductase